MVKVSLVNILIADHRRLQGLFERCLDAHTRADQEVMVDKIIDNLEEEKKLFPMLQNSDFDLFDIGREMLEHKNELERHVHDAVRRLHEEIAAGPCATTEKGRCAIAA